MNAFTLTRANILIYAPYSRTFLVFEGTLPKTIGNMESLIVFTAKNNRRSGRDSNGIGGQLPESLGSLANLVQLDVSKNSLTGEIPNSLGQCTALVTLFFDKNYLEGDVPAELGDLVSIKELNLERNWLEGEVPPALCSYVEAEIQVDCSVECDCCTDYECDDDY